ncbi:MAG: hypothetical protein K8W52_17030 [Deltaproteobacteria bacterium]|nr:hypothetical protein [Deltaproteobacteria bacterium]
MPAPSLTVPFRSLTPVGADALVAMLHGQRAPGAVWLAARRPPPRHRLALGLMVLALALMGTAVALDGAPRAMLVGAPCAGLGAWLIAGAQRAAWLTRTLPWRPGIYAIGPHVVDASSELLVVDALVRVAALDSDPRAIAVMSTREIVVARTDSPAAAQALRARIAEASPSEPGRPDPLREALALRRTRAATSIEPLALRHAWATGVIAAAMLIAITAVIAR